VTSVDEDDIFVTEDFDWKNKVIKHNEGVPIGWTPSLFALFEDMSLDDWLVNPNVFFVPDKLFDDPKRLIRKPRFIIIGFGFGGLYTTTFENLLAEMEDDFNDLGIIVTRTINYKLGDNGSLAGGNCYVLSLPHTDETIVIEHFVGFDEEYTAPKMIPEEWVGGEIFYGTFCSTGGSIAGPYARPDFDNETIEPRTNLMQAHLDTLINNLPRYLKFNYHTSYRHFDFPEDQDWIEPMFLARSAEVRTAFEEYNCTLHDIKETDYSSNPDQFDDDYAQDMIDQIKIFIDELKSGE